MIYIFGHTSFADEKCSITSINSVKQIGIHKFKQQGVGWIYNHKNDYLPVLKIVTPAHVVTESTLVFAECNGKSYELITSGVSPSLDLAILDFKNPKDASNTFNPLFQIKNNTEITDLNLSIFENNFSAFPAAAHFNNSKIVFTHIGATSSANEAKEQFNYEFPQYAKSIILFYGGIRPGMSGSPIFLSNNSLPIGMGLKTKINDHATLILPINELVKQLPKLEKGQDPWLTTHPQYQVKFYNQWDEKTSSLKRFRRLVLTQTNGQPISSFTEKCEFGTMTEVSHWIPSGGSWADSGGSWGDSGGSGSNSSGKNKFKTGVLYTPDLNHTSDATVKKSVEALMYGGTNQYFLSKETCNEEGLLLEPQQQSIIGIRLGKVLKNQDFVLKIESVESLLLALRKLEQQHLAIESILNMAIFNTQVLEDFDPICAKYLLGPNLRANGTKVDTSEQMTFMPARTWGDLDLKDFFKLDKPINKTDSHMIIVREKKYLSSLAENDNVYLKCSEDKKTIDIVTAVKDIAYHFRIEKNHFSGAFSIGDISELGNIDDPTSIFNTYHFDVRTNNFWDYLVEDKKQGFKIQVILNPLNDPLVDIRFLEIPVEEKKKHSNSYQDTHPPIEYIESQWYVK
jgi:hypothetical protein